jgi:DivIVA domain-containing protein
MTLTPEEIESASFPARGRGYDRKAVHEFLARVAHEYRSALQTARESEPYRAVGREVGEFLQHARDTADDMRARADQELLAARREAESIVDRAGQEADRLTREGEREAATARARAEHQVERARAEAERAQSHARSYATVVEREAKRAAAQIRDQAESEAEEVRAAARRDARAEIDRIERRVRQLQGVERSLAQRVNAAEENAESLPAGRRDNA